MTNPQIPKPPQSAYIAVLNDPTMTPDRYVLRTVQTVRSAELEEALLTLPFAHIVLLLKCSARWTEKVYFFIQYRNCWSLLREGNWDENGSNENHVGTICVYNAFQGRLIALHHLCFMSVKSVEGQYDEMLLKEFVVLDKDGNVVWAMSTGNWSLWLPCLVAPHTCWHFSSGYLT